MATVNDIKDQGISGDVEKTPTQDGVVVSELSKEDARRLLRKIDRWIMPLLFVAYMLQYLDKSAMANTAILGLRTDLHLVGQEYSWASSVFNFGYLAASWPIALLIVRFPIGKFMAISIALWAAVLMCMGATHNAAGLIATRFFLGFGEAAVAPGFSLITSMWYKKSEQPLRHGIWFLGNVCSGFFGGPLMYAFDHVETFSPWRLVFLVFGAVTLVYACVLFFILPDSPSSAFFLSETDRVKAVDRVKDDVTGVKHNTWKNEQMIEAMLDPQAWFAIIIMLAVNIPNGGIGNFAGIVIHGFGFSVRDTFLVNMIVTAVQGAFILITTLGSTYIKNTRLIFMSIMSIIGLVGACLIRQLESDNLWGRYAGYCLLSAYTANFPMVLTLNAGNITGITKKTTVSAMTFTAYCVGNIVGPQLFFSNESPSYPSGFAAMLVCFGVAILVQVAWRFYLIRENKRRDRVYGIAAELDERDVYLLDKTDRELTSYRYVY